MGKKDGNKKRKAEDLAEDDENFVDPELQAEIAAVMAAREEAQNSADNQNSSSGKEKTTYNKDGLIKSLENQITELLPFRETYRMCENTIVVQNENDDIEREMAFYNHTLLAVKSGRDKLEALGIPFLRPTDFFCESMKSDAHMIKIKDRLLIEAKRVESFELRKNREQNRKFNKQVSDLRKQEKSAERKQHNADIDKIKKGGDSDEKQDRLKKVLDDNHPEKSKKRQIMDKKYGFGAKDRKMAKHTDRKSLNDLSDFNPRGGKFVRREKSKGSPHGGGGGGGRGGGSGGGDKEYSSFKRGRSGGGAAAKNKKPNRPGKQTRQKNRASKSG